MKTLIASLLVIVIATLPLKLSADPQPPDNNFVIAACIVAAVGAAVTGIYIIAKKCEPKFYWLMDNDNPPNYWVGTCTDKECSINDWTKIGGPYNKRDDAPEVHPPSTNRVQRIEGPKQKITVETTTDMVTWTPVHAQICETEQFAYFPTNTGMFRLQMGMP